MALASSYSETNLKAVKLAKAAVLLNATADAWLTDASSGPIFQCDVTREVEIGRTARKITQRVIGLALSSGGARGIAHIGVLKNFRKS